MSQLNTFVIVTVCALGGVSIARAIEVFLFGAF